VAELQRLAQRELQHLLGPRRERDVPARRLLALADDLLHLLADALQGDPEGLQGLGGHSLALVDEAEEDVLGADVVVVEHPGLFLGQDDNTPCSVGEPLEHLELLACCAVLRRAGWCRDCAVVLGAVNMGGERCVAHAPRSHCIGPGVPAARIPRTCYGRTSAGRPGFPGPTYL
jgi:hypothetical protein